MPADATAFVHRSERFLLDHVAHGGDQWRLRAVKRGYDPERLFRFPQAI